VAVKVKICGVRTPAIIDTAVQEGADFVGLVFFPKSPRYVSPEDAGALAEAARGRIGTVAVLVDPNDALIDRVVAAVHPDLLQLHGSETPERVASIRVRTHLPVMKAIPVAEIGDAQEAGAYAGIADYILFDAKSAPEAVLPGGNGVPFNWKALTGLSPPFALSGGLTPGNVGEAIRLTGASLVDVSSGVERAAGEKDESLVRNFIQAAKATVPQARAKAS
jgi:phosphoribosylanthranilate isomerase